MYFGATEMRLCPKVKGALGIRSSSSTGREMFHMWLVLLVGGDW